MYPRSWLILLLLLLLLLFIIIIIIIRIQWKMDTSAWHSYTGMAKR